MSIKDELAFELRDAMKRQDVPRRELIRIIDTEVALVRSAPGFVGEVDDDLYRKVIVGYAKKMEKARAEYESYGDRGAEMAAKLAWEVQYLARWIPKKLDEEATRTLVSQTIVELAVIGNPKASGQVIGQIMRAHKDQVDGGLVNRLVAELLSAG